MNHQAEGYNPLCGDRFTVYLEMDGDTVRDIGFQGAGCAISKASASMMTQTVKGKTKAEAHKIFQQFHDLVTGHEHVGDEELGKLAVFSGVSEFPMRVKCATLAWHTLEAALEGKQEKSFHGVQQAKEQVPPLRATRSGRDDKLNHR